MKKNVLLLFIALILAYTANAQVFDGVVTDAKTTQLLAYVNVGIIGKSVGTVTNTDGIFKLSLTNSDADSLRISMVGYQAQTYKVSDYVKNYQRYKIISLQPIAVALKEVKVGNKKWKQAVLGNTTKSKGTNAGFNSNKLGNEIGIMINIKRSPTFIKEFHASLSDPSTTNVKMRLNFYTVKDGLPDKLIEQQNIFVNVKKGDESVDVNLEPYNVIVEDKFFVSLEWIETSPGRLMFSASLFKSFYSRETSQANWEKVGIAGIGFNVLAEY